MAYTDDLNMIKQKFTFIFKDYINRCDGDYHYFYQEIIRLEQKYRTSDSNQIIQNIRNNLQKLNCPDDYNTKLYIQSCMISNINDKELLHDLIKFTDINHYSNEERIINLEKRIEELSKLIIQNIKINIETNKINKNQNEH